MTKQARQKRVEQLRQQYHKLDKRRKEILKKRNNVGYTKTKVMGMWLKHISQALDVHLSKLEEKDV